MAQLQQMEEGLMQRIHQAEGDLQAAVVESEGYRKTQEELKVWLTKETGHGTLWTDIRDNTDT